MRTDSLRLTRVQQHALEGVRRACAAPHDSVRLREEVMSRLVPALPAAVYAIATTDPESGVFAHGLHWNYPEATLRAYFAEVYPAESALETLDRARRGEYAGFATGPLERRYLREHGFGSKLSVLFPAQGTIWGGACLSREAGASAFTEEDRGFAALVAPLVGAGLRRAALLEAAQADDAMRATAAAREAGTLAEAPGVAIYDARARLVLRDARAAAYLVDLSDLKMASGGDAGSPEIPSVVAGALAQLRVRQHAIGPATLPSGVRARGGSGRWYTVHASTADHAGTGDEQSVVIITPMGGSDRGSMLARLYGLTPREREVIVRIARGESSKQIAFAIGLSQHTVQAHIDNACTKVGVRGRKELVARLFFDVQAARLAS